MSKLSTTFLCLVLLCPVLSPSASYAAASSEAAKAAVNGNATGWQEIDAAVFRLWSRPHLELSTQDRSYSNSFSFLVKCRQSPADGCEAQWDVLVVCDGERTAAVVQTPEGLPYFYLLNDVAILFDPVRQDRLLLITGAQPEIILALMNGRIRWNVAYTDRHRKPFLTFDIKSLLSGFEDGDIAFNARTRTVRSRRGDRQMLVELMDAKDEFPVRRLQIMVGERAIIDVSSFAFKQDVDTSLLRVTLDDLKQIPLPLRQVTWDERSFVSGIPLGFGKDDRTRNASMTLQRVLMKADSSGD